MNNTFAFRLREGQFLKEEIGKMVIAKDIQAGVLLSVAGSLKNAVLRMAGSTSEKQIIKNWDGPFEIVSGIGTISKNGSHIHVALSDNKGKVIGGHLKEGCAVQTTVEVVIGMIENMTFTRTRDDQTGFNELEIQPTKFI